MAQKRVYFPDIDREDINIRYTIQTEGLGDLVKGAGEFLSGFFGGKKNVEKLEKTVQQQQQQIQQLQTQVEQKQSMPSWIWIAAIGGVLLVVLLAR